jgi:hypothetical protein
LTAWYSSDLNPSGKRSLVFSQARALQPDDPIEIACGQCIGCRLERSKQWAIRCMHEASLYDNNCFLTLTFSPEELAKRDNPWSLNVRDFQLFMKRLRKEFGSKIRFFHCGEYGEVCKFCLQSRNFCTCGSKESFDERVRPGRPHYHACIFNLDFEDKYLWKITNGQRLYRSPTLEKLWPFGHSSIGSVTFESAAYVARYIMKKVTGDMAEEHYESIDPFSGELTTLKPEYTTMSRRPGIGKEWFDQYSADVYPDDFVIVRGKKCRPPKYYDRLLESIDPFAFDDIKQFRLEDGLLHNDNNTPERLAVREKVQLARLKHLPRDKDF